MADRVPIPEGPEALTPAWFTAALTEAGVLLSGAVTHAEWERVGAEFGFTGLVGRFPPQVCGQGSGCSGFGHRQAADGGGRPALGTPGSAAARSGSRRSLLRTLCARSALIPRGRESRPCACPASLPCRRGRNDPAGCPGARRPQRGTAGGRV